MLRLQSLSIRTKLVGSSALVATLGMVMLTLGNVWTVRDSSLKELDAHAVEFADDQVHWIGEWVASKMLVVGTLAPTALESDPTRLLQMANSVGKFAMTYVGFPDKRYAFSTPQQDLDASYDPTSRPWYRSAEKAGQPILTEPYVDAGSSRLVLTFAAPLKVDGKLVGIGAGDIGVDQVVSDVRGIKPSANSFGFLVDARGSIIAHPDAMLTGKPASAVEPGLVPARFKELAAEPHRVVIDGQPYVLLARPVPHTEWTVLIAFSESDALTPPAGITRSALIVGTIALAVVVIAIGSLTHALLLRLDRLRRTLQDIASGEGDLTQRLSETGHDELTQVSQAFNQFVDKIAVALRRIRRSSHCVSSAAEEIAVGNGDLSDRTEQTAAQLQKTASAMGELTGTVRQTAASAHTANHLARAAAGDAERGGSVMGDMVTTMQAISASSRRIADIIGVMDGLSFQTNLLALNATVEAARAGEQGRGFAVVAGEVRSLAKRSARAAQEIKALIGDSVAKVETGAKLVQDAGENMKAIVGSVQRVSRIIVDISTATTEQSEGIGGVGSAVTQIDQMTQQNAALVEQSAAAAQSLKQQAQELARVLAAFRLDAVDEALAEPTLR